MSPICLLWIKGVPNKAASAQTAPESPRTACAQSSSLLLHQSPWLAGKPDSSAPRTAPPRFSLGVGAGAGATTRAPSPPFPSIFPKSKSAGSASWAWQEPSGNRDFSIAPLARHALPRSRPVFILCSWLCVCLPQKGQWPSLPRVKAAQLPQAKANTGAGLRVVTAEGRDFGDVSPVLDVPTILLPSGKGPQDAAFVCSPKGPWVKPPASVELAPHRVPITGAGWVCTGDPPTP